MFSKQPLVIAVLCLFSNFLFAQPLTIDTTYRCLHSGVSFYAQPRQGASSDVAIEKMIDTICELAQLNRSTFQSINARIPSVSAIVDNKGYYLLYNRSYFRELKPEKRQFAYYLLAHELGHIALKHSLKNNMRVREEESAERFAAGVMKKLGDIISLTALLEMINSEPYSYTTTQWSWDARKISFSTGWNTVEALNKGLGFGENKTDVEQSPLPRFEKKGCPKECTLNARRFEGCTTLSDIDFRICRALEAKGYLQRSYFAVKNGYALVVAAEQFNAAPALTSVYGDNRWLDYPARPNFEGVWDYFSKMIWPNPTRFRVFVFVVTNQSVLAYEAGSVKPAECKNWLVQGGNVLPDYLATLAINRHTVRGLVYEFWAEESNKTSKEECIRNSRAEDHLQKSGILDLIKR